MDWVELRIAEVVQETADSRSFVLDVPAGLEDRFAYRAGQFLTFEVQIDGARLLRCYSLASCPELGERPKVTVKRIDDGRVSNWMNDRLAAGDTVRVLPPGGRFVLRDAARPLLLFAAGSGITPVIALVKSALTGTARPVRLVYANRDRASTIFASEVDALAAAHPERLSLALHHDVDAGFLDAAGAGVHAQGWAHGDCYVCGPGPFMDVVVAGASAAGVEEERLFIERFESPPDGQAPGAADPSQSDPSQSDRAPTPAEAGEVAPETLTIRLEGTTTEVPYDGRSTVLAAAQAAGLDPPYACTEGFCGSCAARLASGRAEMGANDVFNKNEVAQGHVLTCQARVVAGPCEVVYE